MEFTFVAAFQLQKMCSFLRKLDIAIKSQASYKKLSYCVTEQRAHVLRT